jgi:hypothetical protein
MNLDTTALNAEQEALLTQLAHRVPVCLRWCRTGNWT